jgi:cell division protein FtsW (lipid II flippase)
VRLITAHRVLIIAGIAFFLLYAMIETRQWMRTGSGVALAQAIVSPLIAAGFAIYYRSLAKRWGK